jgi:transglutaminase-like putative cysteine protease
MKILGLFSPKSLLTGKRAPTAWARFADYKEVAKFLRRMVNLYRGNDAVREIALKAIKDAGVEAKDKKGQALAIAEWVQTNIYYVHELPERFQTPIKTLSSKAGDCDDFTTLISAMLESVGIGSRMVLMRIDGIWKHIYPTALVPNGSTVATLPLDATLDFPVAEWSNPIGIMKAKGKDVFIITA